MKSKTMVAAILAIAVLQWACGGEGHRSASPAAPVSIPTLILQTESVPAIVAVPGSIAPRDRVPLAAQINGYVRSVHVRVGDSVAKGQLLAALDARDAESQTAAAQSSIDEVEAALTEAHKSHRAALDMEASARASAELAAQTLARYEKLYAAKSASAQEMDEIRMRRNASAAELAGREAMVAAAEARISQAEARIAQARAQADRANVQLGWTRIHAPSAGKIVERSVDPGAAIFAGTPLLVIESAAHPQAVADLPTEHAVHLGSGQVVRLRIGTTDQVLEGKISEITPRSDPTTHSLQFKVDLPAKALVPTGQFVRIDIPVGTRKALLAPKESIRKSGQLTGIFIIDKNSTSRFRLVKLAPYDTHRMEILSGAEAGEIIVARLNRGIIDGTPVSVAR